MEWAHERFASVAVTLLPLLLDAAIKGATLLVITAAVAFAMRRASAAARHLVWFLAIAALLFMPLFSATLPGWHILPNWIQPSTAPRRGAAAGFPPAPTPATAADSATIDSPPPYLGRSIPQNSHPLPIIPPPTWKPPPAPSSPTLVSPAPPSIPPTVPLPAAQPQSLNPLTWQTRILLAWLTGTVLYAGYILAGSLSLYRLSRRSSPLTDPDWSTLLSQACQALAFHRPIKLITHPRRSMPMTWGFWRAWILIPQDAEDWTADQRRAVLLHELAHARRWDCLTQLITQLALACYWFNPLVWLAWKAIQTERERACDDLVLSTGQRASAYAEQLLHLAADLPALHYPAAIAMARPGRLEQRLLAILDPHRRRRLAARTAVVLCLAAALSAAIVATLRAGEVITDSALIAVTKWAHDRGWKAQPVAETNLETWDKGWRNLPFALDPAEEADAKACMKLGSLAGSTVNGVSQFGEPSTADALEAILQHRPHYFYAEFLLAQWNQDNGQLQEGEKLREAAYRDAPVVIAQRYAFADGTPLADTPIDSCALECNRVQHGYLDPSLELSYHDLRTDADGCIYLPVYDTVFRRDEMADPDGYSAAFPTLAWFQTSRKVAMLPVATVTEKPGDFAPSAQPTDPPITQATLPGGIVADFVGVHRYAPTTPAAMSPSIAADGWNFQFRFSKPTIAGDAIKFRFSVPNSTASYPTEIIKQRLTQPYVVFASLPTHPKQVSIQVGLAGPWKSAASCDPHLSNVVGTLPDGFSLRPRSKNALYPGLAVVHPRTDVEVRVLAIDSKGQEHTTNEWGTELSNSAGAPEVFADRFGFDMPAGDIASYRVELRSYQWAEFSNIALVSTGLPPQTQPATRPSDAESSPIVRRVLAVQERADGKQDRAYLDLDDGQFVSARTLVPSRYQDPRNRRIDLAARRQDAGIQVIAEDMQLSSADPAGQEIDGPGMSLDAAEHRLAGMNATPESPLQPGIAYFFRSRQGDVGAVRIGNPTGDSAAVTYRIFSSIPWGDAGNGVRVRLRGNDQWRAGQTPSFVLDVSNVGKQNISLDGVAAEECRFLIDGKWYGYSRSFMIKALELGLAPGEKAVDFIPITLDSAWAQLKSAAALKKTHTNWDDWGPPLNLSAGRHTLAVELNKFEGGRVNALSNPLPFDILLPLPPPPPPTTQPALRDLWGEDVGVLRYRLVPLAGPITTQDDVTAVLEVENVGNKPVTISALGNFFANVAGWWWKHLYDPTTWTAGDPQTGRDTGKPISPIPAGGRALLICHFNEKLSAGKYELECGFSEKIAYMGNPARPLPVALFVVEPGQSAPPDNGPPDYSPAAPWGSAVDHMHARLRRADSVHDTGNIDDLTIDLQNVGNRQLAFDPLLDAMELEIDGHWYHTVSENQSVNSLLPFGPGYRWDNWANGYNKAQVNLYPTADWRDADNHPLRLAHGKHTVRLAITLPPMPGSGETPVRLVTNAVERNTTRDFGSAKPMPFINANQPAPNGPLPATDPATPELRGTVIGADGKPAVGLEVILHGPDPSDAKAATEHCDAQGHYAFVNIPAGKYTLSAAPFTVLSVSIEPGKTLVEAFSSVTRFKVTGRVTYHDGKPVADQLVDVLTKSDDGRILFDRWATTGADGRYSVGTPFDKVESVAEAGSFRDPLHDTKASAGPIDLVELGDSPAPPAPPATQPATQSSARPGDPPTTRPGNIAVTAEMLGTHLPVAGAKVSWSADPRLNGSGRTDAAGRVAIAGISDRCRYLIVRISRPGLTPLFLRWEHSPDDPLPPSPTFFMEPGHRVGGIVIDTAGKPIAGATVVVQARKAYPGYPQMIDGLDDGITDATGHWSVDGVPASPDTLSIAAYDVMHLEREYYSAQPYSPQSSLFAGAAKLTLPMATPIDVRVLKTDGTPAGGAKVLFGYEPGVYGNSMPAVTADRQGIAHLGCKPGMGARLSATLPGFVPAQQDIVVAETPMRLTLQLAVGTRRTIDVVDSDGKPISGAGIDVRNWRGGGFPLWVHLQADRAGHAVWNDAPADDVTVTAYATGYSQRDDLPWSATQPTRIVLSKPATLTARVVDADTGKPIGGFTLRLGAVWHQGDRLVWQPTENLRDTKKVPGGFSLELPRSAYRYLLRVGADGYLPADSELLALDGHDKPLDFRLKPGVDVAGITSSADGKPVANTKVCLVTEGDWLLLNNGDVPRDSHDPAVLALSGATGRFAFPPQKDDFALVAISDYGSAALMRSEFAGGGASLKLSPWASVNGTITIAGKPAANLDVMGESEPIALADGTQLMARQYQFTTDENGNFEVPRVFPGKLKLFREVPNFAPMRFRNFTLLTLDAKPGEHYHVALGQGAAVTGSLAIPPGKPWMIRIARLDRKSAPADADLENVDVSADGHFRAEGIAPGDYTLHIALHEFPPGDACGWGRLVAQFDRDITVPHLPAGGQSVDTGTIAPTALPGPMLKVGDPAPDFTVKTLAGKTLRLSDLRGKVVLLDFWATWCAPCVAELPDLKQIADSNGGPKSGLVILSLSLDDDSQPLQRLIRYYGLTWPQARVGIDGDVVKAYGATAIPATFLIGGDGKILARDLCGDAINDAVRAALAQKQ